MSTLEQRYRRLIALYPAWHRQRYQAEMLSTLMDGASARQRTPRLRESADLLWGALRLRFVPQGVPRGRDLRWQDAASVFAVLTAMTLSAIHLMRPLSEIGWWQRLDGLLPWIHEPWSSFGAWEAAGASWLMVAIVALTRWRIAAAGLAWATVLAFAGWPLLGYADHPHLVVNAWPSIVCGATIAACLSLPATRPARQLLGRQVLPLFGVAAAAAGSSLWLDAMLAKVVTYGLERNAEVSQWGGNVPWTPIEESVGTIGAASLLTYVAFLAMVIWALAKVGAPIRRRLLALAAVPITTAILVANAYADAKYLWDSPRTSGGLHMPPPPTIGQWLALLLLPLAAFGAGVLLVRRADNRQEVTTSERVPGQQPLQ